jgi:hypothetical protein
MIEASTLSRLKSDRPCPDSILAERVRNLPDLNLVLLESTGFEDKSLNEDGQRVDEVWTNFKLVEVLRGRSDGSWASVRAGATIPYPGDYHRTLPNTGLLWAKKGERVLAFSNLYFDSCRMVPATGSAISGAERDTGSSPC